MKYGKKLFIIVSMMATLSACGGSAANTSNELTAQPNNSTPSGGNGANNVPNFNQVYPGSNSTNADDSIPPYSFSFDVTGSSGGTGSSPTFTAPNISTDNRLIVALDASSPGSISSNGQNVVFNCVKYDVTVRPSGSTSGGQTQTEFVSTTGKDGTGPCAGATAKTSKDFSSLLTPGHGQMDVIVKVTYYDSCRQSQLPQYMSCTAWGCTPAGNLYAGCALNQVYYTHHISTDIRIYTNGTN